MLNTRSAVEGLVVEGLDREANPIDRRSRSSRRNHRRQSDCSDAERRLARGPNVLRKWVNDYTNFTMAFID